MLWLFINRLYLLMWFCLMIINSVAVCFVSGFLDFFYLLFMLLCFWLLCWLLLLWVICFDCYLMFLLCLLVIVFVFWWLFSASLFIVLMQLRLHFDVVKVNFCVIVSYLYWFVVCIMFTLLIYWFAMLLVDLLFGIYFAY